MRLQDIAIRAMDGMAFVDGELRLEGNGDYDLPQSKPGELIGVELSRKGFGRTAFSLFRRIEKGGDGLFGATPPVLTIEFAETLPRLFDLLVRNGRGGRYRLSADGLRVVEVRFHDPSAPTGSLRSLYADGTELDLRLAVDERGLHISFEAPIRPTTRLEHTPVFQQAKAIANLTVPAAYCRLQHAMPLIPSSSDADRAVVGHWHSTGHGMTEIPINLVGAPYCSGTLDWQDNSRFALTGPFVELYLHENDFTARPVGGLQRLESGFVEAAKYRMDGPQLCLNMGYRQWASMLDQAEEAEIELAGAGIGQVDGQTGRSVGECGGPMTQPITRLRLSLARRPEGLAVAGIGELAPLHSDPQESLGPQLTFNFLIPRTWILARGIPLRGFWDSRKADFPSEDTW